MSLDAPRIARRAFLGMAAALAAAGIVPAAAQGVSPAALTPEERAEVERIESYLSSVRTMRAKFVQVSSSGAYAEGTFYLSRPGRLRFEYQPPSPLLIVADGTIVYSHDLALKQTTQIPLGLTPLWFLLRDRIRFAGDVTLTKYERVGGVARVTLVQTKDPAAGAVTLALQAEPLALRQWSVVDAQGITTNIALTEAQQDVRLDSRLFVFTEDLPRGNETQR